MAVRLVGGGVWHPLVFMIIVALWMVVSFGDMADLRQAAGYGVCGECDGDRRGIGG